MNIPNIGLGVGGYDYNTTYNAVLNALQVGYRLIDTAENYKNEEAVGNAIIDSGIDRKEITIVSKYFGGINFGNANDAMNSLNISLQKLKTDYIDIYLVHTPFGCKWVHEWEPFHDDKYVHYKNRVSIWLQLMDLKKKKKVKYIGVSNWTLDNIQYDIKGNKLNLPDIIQNEWCPSFHDDNLYNFCVKNSIKMMGYGLFSRNSIHTINNIQLHEKEKTTSEILVKWCIQKDVILIQRSNNMNNMVSNLNACNASWLLCDEDMSSIDKLPQECKGHCLKTVYDRNIQFPFWEPIILQTCELENSKENNTIRKLVDGKISCIVMNNLIAKDDCKMILKTMEDKDILKNQLPYNNHGISFRHNEIGITLDNMGWRNNPDLYFNECVKANELFDSMFEKECNPFTILYETVQKLAGNNYSIRRNNRGSIECPIGVFRIFSPESHAFPYHTDGFNYGNILNRVNSINKELFPLVSNSDTKSVIAIILVLQQTNNHKNEIDLYNCLVDDLEEYKDEIGMHSHWMGTKYTNTHVLETKLKDKPFYSPILGTGDLYIFSASRIHKLNNLIENDNRIVLATFACICDNEIVIYQ